MKHIQIFNIIRSTIRNYGMLSKGDRVLVCVSGGPDSIFLLRALIHLSKELSLTLYIAHLEHGLRGRESLADMQFVKKIALEYKLKFFGKRVKIKKTKEFSLEEAARKARYDLFESVAKKNKIKKIATAHSADDQAETVLMRIIKGVSLKGLAGIPPVRKSDGLVYIRPIIDLEKKEILEFLDSNKITYRIDRTNAENKHFRNVVRNKILPYLRKYNPRISRTLSNMADSLRDDSDFIVSFKENAEKGILKGKGAIKISLKKITAQPEVLQREIIKDALSRSGCNIKKLTIRHWKMIRHFIYTNDSSKALELPGNIQAKLVNSNLVLRISNLR